MRRAVGITVGAFGVLGAVAVLAPTPACTNHQCDAPPTITIDVQDDAGAGEVTDDPNTWESSPAYGPWLSFPAQMTYQFQMPSQFAGRQLETTTAYLSVAPDQTAPGAIWVQGSGNAAEFSFVPAGPGATNPAPTITLFNDTCAQYWVRAVITFAPAADAAASDAGVDASDAADADVGDVADAGADAESDASAK